MFDSPYLHKELLTPPVRQVVMGGVSILHTYLHTITWNNLFNSEINPVYHPKFKITIKSN